MTQTYSSYLMIDELLSLQKPKSADASGQNAEHDEMLFIIIHQVYELWFKQMLHEADELCRRFGAGDEPAAASTLHRMRTILKTMVAQIDVLETMTPISFLSFRDRLGSASGFQSAQFREFEFVMGNKNPRMVQHHAAAPETQRRLEQRLHAPTVFDCFLRFLHAKGYEMPADVLHRDVTQPLSESEAVQAQLIRVYRNDPTTRMLCESLVDLDEGVQEWRYRHVKMVERTIGFKQGTGGSAGAEYLRTTLFRPFFPDLWAIRTSL